MNVVIDKEQLEPYIIYDKSIRYDEKITLYPIKMKNIVDFQLFQTAITVRKDAIFQDKKVIKMGYFEFIQKQYITTNYHYYHFFIQLLFKCYQLFVENNHL